MRWRYTRTATTVQVFPPHNSSGNSSLQAKEATNRPASHMDGDRIILQCVRPSRRYRQVKEQTLPEQRHSCNANFKLQPKHVYDPIASSSVPEPWIPPSTLDPCHVYDPIASSSSTNCRCLKTSILQALDTPTHTHLRSPPRTQTCLTTEQQRLKSTMSRCHSLKTKGHRTFLREGRERRVGAGQEDGPM
jgi:hypothetical protein